jgi:hypothetical protein
MVVSRHPARKVCFLCLLAGLLLLFLLAACGNNAGTTSKSATTGKTNTHSSAPATGTVSSATNAAAATATSLMKMVSLIGQPTVKMLSNTTFEADGKVKNNDTAQHDITLEITLMDATGKVVGSATELVDNVPAGQTASYAMQGQATQSTWTNVEITVVKISENIPGSG